MKTKTPSESSQSVNFEQSPCEEVRSVSETDQLYELLRPQGTRLGPFTLDQVKKLNTEIWLRHYKMRVFGDENGKWYKVGHFTRHKHYLGEEVLRKPSNAPEIDPRFFLWSIGSILFAGILFVLVKDAWAIFLQSCVFIGGIAGVIGCLWLIKNCARPGDHSPRRWGESVWQAAGRQGAGSRTGCGPIVGMALILFAIYLLFSGEFTLMAVVLVAAYASMSNYLDD